MPSYPLRALGFCGADDSVHPHHLVVLAQAWPAIEWGVLFRPDKQGQARYATNEWIERLARAGSQVQLAAHLCGEAVQDVLEGRMSYVSKIVHDWGFGRIQINATANNGVDTSRLGDAVPNVVQMIQSFPNVEFIIQQNEETQPLWKGLVDHYHEKWPNNVSFLADESKGTGKTTKSWPRASSVVPTGYAGGIGPHNITTVLPDIVEAAQGKPFWIDMESSLRSIKNGQDVFDLDKCYQVIEAVSDLGLMERPDYLPQS